MKKFIVCLVIAMVAITGVFAAKAVGDPDFTVTAGMGWDRIAKKDAIVLGATVDHTVYTNEDFEVGVLADLGLDIFVDAGNGAKFTQFIGPVFTFTSVAPNTDIKVAVGPKFVDYTNYFDVGLCAELLGTYWVGDGFGVVLKGQVTRLLKTNTNSYGVGIGLGCNL